LTPEIDNEVLSPHSLAARCEARQPFNAHKTSGPRADGDVMLGVRTLVAWTARACGSAATARSETSDNGQAVDLSRYQGLDTLPCVSAGPCSHKAAV
jgi:hypothetical protein